MKDFEKHTQKMNQDPSTDNPANESFTNDAILVIDNYDSFTYNLVHAIRKISGRQVDVYRNDQISLQDVDRYNKIILSPGPGLPHEAGILLDVIRTYAPTKSILGVCLGHQAIGVAFGGNLQNMNRVIHGMATRVKQIPESTLLFKGLPDRFDAGRYHSWTVENQNLPECLEVTSYDEEGRIMSMKHREYDVEGVQFHPESVLTPLGEQILKNWLQASPAKSTPLNKAG